MKLLKANSKECLQQSMNDWGSLRTAWNRIERLRQILESYLVAEWNSRRIDRYPLQVPLQQHYSQMAQKFLQIVDSIYWCTSKCRIKLNAKLRHVYLALSHIIYQSVYPTGKITSSTQFRNVFGHTSRLQIGTTDKMLLISRTEEININKAALLICSAWWVVIVKLIWAYGI